MVEPTEGLQEPYPDILDQQAGTRPARAYSFNTKG